MSYFFPSYSFWNLFMKKKRNLFMRERKREWESTSRGGAQGEGKGEGEEENLRQTPLWSRSPARGSTSQRKVTPWAKTRSWALTQRSPPGTPSLSSHTSYVFRESAVLGRVSAGNSFLLNTSSCVDVPQFIPSLVRGHLGCFLFRAVIKRASGRLHA